MQGCNANTFPNKTTQTNKTMQYTLTKEAFEALDETIKKEYKLEGEVATLNVEGDPNADALAKSEAKRKLEAEHTKNAEKKLAEADKSREQLQKDLDAAGNNKGEIDKVRADFAAQLDKIKEERLAESDKIRADRDKALIMEEATKLSQKFSVPAVMAAQIASRLTVVEAEGQQAIRALTEDGKESISTVSEMFQKDFLDNPALAPIILTKVGNGGGASPNNGGGASGKKLSEMDADEAVAFLKEQPEQYVAQAKA